MVSIELVKEKAEEQLEKIIQWRRFLHQHPEPAYQEQATSAFVIEQLKKMDISYQSGIAQTGIVALIKGKNPDKKCIALRADMDALPIEEQNTCSYASQKKGYMHACGHDVHTASLLGAASLLQKFREEWEGTIKLIFQPAEEVIPSGAAAMIQEGALENPRPSCIFGMHVTPELDCGTIGYKPGAFMAACDEIYIEIQAQGGHAAKVPNHENPLFTAAKILTAFENKSDASLPLILNFGKIEGLGKTNIIPNKVKIEGTLRTFDEQLRMQMHHDMEEQIKIINARAKCVASLTILKGYPVLINDEKLTLHVKNCAENYLGVAHTKEVAQRMGAEDFAYYSKIIPSCFLRLGTGSAPETRFELHHPRFDIDEKALLHASGLFAWIAMEWLHKNP